jgi:hypothetical protein
MSRARKAVAAVVGITLIAGVPAAQAARRKPVPKPICNLVVDPADTMQTAPAPSRPMSPSIDIRSADVATDQTKLTWVIRVSNLSAPVDETTALGRVWSFRFKVNGKEVFLQVLDGPFGARDGSGNGAAVKLDPAKNEVRYTIPLATIKQAKAVSIIPGVTVLREFHAQANGAIEGPEATNFGPDSFVDNDQTDTSARTYRAGQLSCVKPG